MARAIAFECDRVALAVFVVCAILASGDCGDIAEAQAPVGAPALALARVCAGETAWSALDECTAIGEVLARRSSTGAVTPEIAQAYSAALRRPRRPWVAELAPDGARPPSWPEGVSWARWRPRWLALLEHARRVVAGSVASPCVETPHHWGGPMDSWRAQRAGWHEVDCGQTRNTFWVVR